MIALFTLLLFFVSILGFSFFNFKAKADTNTANIQLSGTLSKSKLYVDEELEVSLKLTPTGEINIPRSPASVVIVVDSSGSMQNNGKMDAAKSAAKNLIDSLLSSAKAGDKIGVIDFDTSVNDGGSYYLHYYSHGREYYEFTLTNNNSTNGLLDLNSSNAAIAKNKINSMSAMGGTNFEAAFKEAKEYLSTSPSSNSKYVVFITDGMPTYYYNGTRNGYPVVDGPGSAPNATTKAEAKTAAQQLATIGAKIFMVGVDTSGAEIDKNFIDDIASTTNGKSYYTSNTNSINSMLQEIFKIINKAVIFDNLNVEYQIPAGLTVNSAPSGWTVSNGKLTGTFNQVTFENGSGTPLPQEVKFKIKANAEGTYNLGSIVLNYRKYDTDTGEQYLQLTCDLGSVEFVRRPGINATWQIIGVSNAALPNKPYDMKVNISAFGKSLGETTTIKNFQLVMNNSNVTVNNLSTASPEINYPIDQGPNTSTVSLPYSITFNRTGTITLSPQLVYEINGVQRTLNLSSMTIMVFDYSDMLKGFAITKKMIADNSTANLSLKIDDRSLFTYYPDAKIVVNLSIENMSPSSSIVTTPSFPIQITVDRNTNLNNGLRTITKTIGFKLNNNATAGKFDLKISDMKLVIGTDEYSIGSGALIQNIVVKKAILR